MKKFTKVNEESKKFQFDLSKLTDIKTFLIRFSDYSTYDLVANISYLEQYKDDLNELFASLQDSDRYGDVGSKEGKLQYKILEYIIVK